MPATANAGPAPGAAARVTTAEIDGGYGEGGGQLVRTAVAVSAVSGGAVRISNIRPRRRVPGLAPQHVAAVRAVAALCDAQCEGLEPRSTAVSFAPRRLHGGEFEFDIGTAGSIALVLQALLPAAAASHQQVVATIHGGTDLPAAPPLDYLRLVLLPLLERMGLRARLTVVRRGYYPRGGGIVRLAVEPTARLRSFVAAQRGAVAGIEAVVHLSRLPRHVGDRMLAAAQAALPADVPFAAQVEQCGPEAAVGTGGAILLRAVAAGAVLGAARVAERGVRAEQVGEAAARMLAGDLDAAATLDIHAADQMLVYAALADGPSLFRAARVSQHAATAMWVLEQLTRARFDVQPDGPGVIVRVRPWQAQEAGRRLPGAPPCFR